MADQEETFGLQNSPGGTDSRELQSDNKSEKQNGTSSKSPSSQTTYIQQVSTGQSVGLTHSHCCALLPRTTGVTFTVKNGFIGQRSALALWLLNRAYSLECIIIVCRSFTCVFLSNKKIFSHNNVTFVAMFVTHASLKENDFRKVIRQEKQFQESFIVGKFTLIFTLHFIK